MGTQQKEPAPMKPICARLGKTYILIAAVLVGGCAEKKLRPETSRPQKAPAATPAATPEPEPTTEDPVERPKRAEYAPHVVIDWSVPQVEVAAEVVLCEGDLELLLCSKGTKEHESTLATPARPKHIFEALGLIGVTPGNPPAFDLDKREPIPAAGQRLAIEIVSQESAGKRVSAAHEWMMQKSSQQTMPAPRWVFCGSRVDETGRFAADSDGTIVCVVDFDSAVVGVAGNYTADNDALWLAADPHMIPELGTTCTVILRPLDEAPMELTFTSEGLFEWNDRVLGALELDEIIRERTRHNPDQTLVLTEAPGDHDPHFARFAALAIVGSGIKRENLKLNLLPRPEQAAQPTPAEAPESQVEESSEEGPSAP
jgi:hypothetical protein